MPGPVAVPRRWRPVRFDGFQVDVPTTWSISNVSADCGTLVSGSPSAYEGRSRFTASCALVLPIYRLRPGNGVWLEQVAGRGPAPADTYNLHINGLGVKIRPATSVLGGQGGVPIVNLTVVTAHQTLQAQLGLGTDPAVAEEVLSSLHYVGAAEPSTPVDTQPSTPTTSVQDETGPATTATTLAVGR
jgi:hypothetical protein